MVSRTPKAIFLGQANREKLIITRNNNIFIFLWPVVLNFEAKDPYGESARIWDKHQIMVVGFDKFQTAMCTKMSNSRMTRFAKMWMSQIFNGAGRFLHVIGYSLDGGLLGSQEGALRLKGLHPRPSASD